MFFHRGRHRAVTGGYRCGQPADQGNETYKHFGASWLLFSFEPRERMRAPGPVKEVRHIGLMGEELASFLNTLKALDEPQFRAVEKSLRLIIPSVSGIQVDVNDLGEVELRLVEGNTPVPARVLSEGTLRTLGLLALDGAKGATGVGGNRGTGKRHPPEPYPHDRRAVDDTIKNREHPTRGHYPLAYLARLRARCQFVRLLQAERTDVHRDFREMGKSLDSS